MKKAAVPVLFLVVFLSGCASAPSWTRERPPAGMIWGIGGIQGPGDGASLSLSQNRGRLSIARQLDRIAGETLRKHLRRGEKDAAAAPAGGRLLSINLQNARVLQSWKAPDGRWWSRVEISAGDAEAAILESLPEIPRREEFRELLRLRLLRRAARPLVVAR